MALNLTLAQTDLYTQPTHRDRLRDGPFDAGATAGRTGTVPTPAAPDFRSRQMSAAVAPPFGARATALALRLQRRRSPVSRYADECGESIGGASS